ncbi:hypothetical protein N8772_02430 [Rickettsiales bacterium]|nr:hypothetical protein [Rickettsiales bacterium]
MLGSNESRNSHILATRVITENNNSVSNKEILRICDILDSIFQIHNIPLNIPIDRPITYKFNGCNIKTTNPNEVHVRRAICKYYDILSDKSLDMGVDQIYDEEIISDTRKIFQSIKSIESRWGRKIYIPELELSTINREQYIEIVTRFLSQSDKPKVTDQSGILRHNRLLQGDTMGRPSKFFYSGSRSGSSGQTAYSSNTTSTSDTRNSIGSNIPNDSNENVGMAVKCCDIFDLKAENNGIFIIHNKEDAEFGYAIVKIFEHGNGKHIIYYNPFKIGTDDRDKSILEKKLGSAVTSIKKKRFNIPREVRGNMIGSESVPLSKKSSKSLESVGEVDHPFGIEDLVNRGASLNMGLIDHNIEDLVLKKQGSNFSLVGIISGQEVEIEGLDVINESNGSSVYSLTRSVIYNMSCIKEEDLANYCKYNTNKSEVRDRPKSWCSILSCSSCSGKSSIKVL